MCMLFGIFEVISIYENIIQKSTSNCFDSFNSSDKTGMQISIFSFALDKFKSSFKVFVNCRSKIVM